MNGVAIQCHKYQLSSAVMFVLKETRHSPPNDVELFTLEMNMKHLISIKGRQASYDVMNTQAS